MRLCNIGETEICLSFETIPILLACSILYPWKVVLSSIAALTLHEIAHVLTAHRLAYTVNTLRLTPFGAWMQLESMDGGENGIFWVVAAGPFSNLTAAGAVALLRYIGIGDEISSLFLVSNLCLGVSNFLPIYPLDGGRILKTLTERSHTRRFADKTTFLTSAFCIAITLLIGVWCMIQMNEPALLAFGLSILCCTVIAYCRSEQQSVGTIVRHRQALQERKAIPVQAIVIRQSAPIGTALEQLRSGTYQILYVLDEQNRPIGKLDEEALLCAVGTYGSHIKLREIMQFKK